MKKQTQVKINKLNSIIEKLEERRHIDFQRVTQFSRPMKFKLTYERIAKFEAILAGL